MPLSEVHQAAKSKLERSQTYKMSNCSSDVSSFMPENDFVELLWENGQIMMQGQSNRPKKPNSANAFPAHNGKLPQEKETNSPKSGKFTTSEVDSMVNDLSPGVPSAPDDDIVRWMNYPMEDPLQSDYCSDFFSEFPGFNLNSLTNSNNNSVPPTADRGNGFAATRDSHNNVEHGNRLRQVAGVSDSSKAKASQYFPLPVAVEKSRASEFGGSSNNNVHQGDHHRIQKQDTTASKPIRSSSNMGVMNFSHFSRPVAIVKANLQSVDRLRSNAKAMTATATNPIESTLVDSASNFKSVSEVDGKPASLLPPPPNHKVELRPSWRPNHETASTMNAVCQEELPRQDGANKGSSPPDNGNHCGSSCAASTGVVRVDTEKGPEAVVASSMCSGNSAGATYTDPKQKGKRKNWEGDESGDHSEDLEDKSIGIKKPATGKGSCAKRTRAAEVHNLSERRRRDRINERMRALQELIPNCNKVDKASMLDEAIEYLKTLQLQVQLMSMGSNLCMSPMMLPAGMQHIRAPPLTPFTPMGVGMGMGMGMGYGMGMLDMVGSSLIPVPPMHGSQFACPTIPGAQSLHGIFGIPGQSVPMPMPRPAPYTSISGPFTKGSCNIPEISGAGTSVMPAGDAAANLILKDQQQQQQPPVNLATSEKPDAAD